MSDEQWELIRKHFPEDPNPGARPGRKPIPARHVLEAGMWIFNAGAQWHMLPQSYRNCKTVHRRIRQRCENEVIRAALTELVDAPRKDRAIDSRGIRSSAVIVNSTVGLPIDVRSQCQAFRWDRAQHGELRPGHHTGISP
jgi:transposase